MNKSLIASVLALAFAGAAQAGTYHADHFTVTYDDNFWGSTFAGGSGGSFSFTALEELGLTASSDGKKNLWKYDGWSGNSALTIVADAGYRITGITSGTTGAISATASGNNEAAAQVNTSANWYSGSNYLGSSYTFDHVFVGPSGTSGINGPFNSQGSVLFAANTGAAALDYYTDGYTQARGIGSNASAAQSSAYFIVATAPVPEPESYALLLAGLGLMGTIARRRARNA